MCKISLFRILHEIINQLHTKDAQNSAIHSPSNPSVFIPYLFYKILFLSQYDADVGSHALVVTCFEWSMHSGLNTNSILLHLPHSFLSWLLFFSLSFIIHSIMLVSIQNACNNQKIKNNNNLRNWNGRRMNLHHTASIFNRFQLKLIPINVTLLKNKIRILNVYKVPIRISA